MSNKQESIEILTGMIYDIATSVEIVRFFESGIRRANDDLRRGIYRVCLQSIVLNLAKFLEFHEKYNQFLHCEVPEYTELRKKVSAELIKKGVKDLRNKFLAHIQCKKSKRTLTAAEIDQYLQTILGGSNAETFFEWLLPEDTSGKMKTDYFLGIIETIRDALYKKS